jgi:RNA polymerase sigma-70 factor (ECF subfamily)
MIATESDESLVLKVREGNEYAFAQLVNRHNKKFYHLAFRYMSNQEDAEDIVQSAFLKFWERPGMWKADKKTKFTTWFYRLVVNSCLDSKKKHKSLPMAEGFEVQDKSRNQEQRLLLGEQQVMLQNAVSKLPDRQRTALILCAFEEVSQKAAAEVMKINLQALQSLLKRAKNNLAKTLKIKEGGNDE